MANFGGLSDIADSMASAAIDPSRWDAAMEVAAGATGSIGAILMPLRGRAPNFPASEGMLRTKETFVAEGWIHRDERYRAVPKILSAGVATDSDFITDEEIARHPYWQELLRPRNLRWFAGVKVGQGEDVWGLALHRSLAQGPFDPDEIQRLASLSRNLAGAAELARAFGFARVEAAAQALEASGSAVAMIDRFGQVLRLNPSAERLFCKDLQINGRRIVSTDRDATAALDRALHALIWSRGADAFLPPVALPRRTARPILAYPSRLPETVKEGFALCVGFVLFVDLEARRLPHTHHLAKVFGLTRTEAEVAAAIAEGLSLEEIAERRAISPTTARNQLKAVLSKTDTHRQSELVALLAKLPRR